MISETSANLKQHLTTIRVLSLMAAMGVCFTPESRQGGLDDAATVRCMTPAWFDMLT